MANILVVDDELGIRDLLSEILFDEGHQVGPQLPAHRPRLGRVFGQFDRVTFVIEDFREQVPDAQFVVHYQNRCHGSLCFPRSMLSICNCE